MNPKYLIYILAVVLFAATANAKEDKEIVDHDKMLMDHGNGHLMDMEGGMVMGQNTETLPRGCRKISEDKEITVKAGHKYAKIFPGRMFAFDQQEFHFKPCTRLTVHFINEDSIRHQFMMHGLPKDLYPLEMFHLEVTGPGKISGTLVLPNEDKTYLVHCDIAQHMQKGMKAQLIVGTGSGQLPSIPGVTAFAIPDSYDGDATVHRGEEQSAVSVERKSAPLISGLFVIGLALGLLIAPILAKRYKGMSAGDVMADITALVKKAIGGVMQIISWVSGLFGVQKKVT